MVVGGGCGQGYWGEVGSSLLLDIELACGESRLASQSSCGFVAGADLVKNDVIVGCFAWCSFS